VVGIGFPASALGGQSSSRTVSERRGWPYLLHPFLAGIYFVLTLAASNAISLHGWRDLTWPLPTAILVAGILWLLAYAVTRSPEKAAILSLIWTIAFSVFGYAAEVLLPSGAIKAVGGELGLFGLFLLMLLGPSLAIRKSHRSFDSYNRFATVVTAILVVYTFAQLYRGLHRERNLQILVPPPASTWSGAAGPEPPDIFLIILDKYTGGELLADHFRYDNSKFETFLRNRGFIVPRHARANYPQTQLALAAMLNLDYIQNLPRQVHLFDLIENNRLETFLKQRNYRLVFFPTGFKFTSRNRNADLQLPEPTQVRGEFGGVWQRTTMLPEFFRVGCALFGCRAGRLVYVAEGPDLMDWKFQQLQNLAGSPSPTYVFAHLALPHEPYIYNADCTHREPYFPAGAGVIGNVEAAQAYLDQLTCVNIKVSALVDSILARSRRPPIILLQADHGHGRFGRYLPAYDDLDTYRLRERMSVFCAYYLPGLSSDSVTDSVTPINAARLVLRYYFGADLPPLKEESYWATESHVYDFTRITR
jgi:hypothetical protein